MPVDRNMSKLNSILKKMRRLPGYQSQKNIEVADYLIQNDSTNKKFYALLQAGEQLQVAYVDGCDERWDPILEMIENDIDEELSGNAIALGVIVGGKTYPVVRVQN